ncbi:RNA methyltransferase [Paenibacillus antri]|uniref:RNA methyltransferase n=1 Tax=Paenibacillus antri TaxID=2582848 RepID=A0A5R9GC29_9BACL|nr:RNA methyltransferase [Paenibacillus antri]TLS53301.1 RNA methyltransferase [Paenibacillus antri]
MREAEPIRSLQNPQVKAWASLLSKKGRDEAGRFLVEGAHLVVEALRSGYDVAEVLYVPGSPAAAEAAAAAGRSTPDWIPVSEQVMAKVAEARTPQGVAAVVKQRTTTLDELLAAKGQGPFIAVDAVQDPGNLGTILRSADAAGARAVLLGVGTVDVYNPKTIRATMGALFHVPIVACDLAEALPRAKNAGVRVVGTSLEARRSCYEAPLGGDMCFLFGNEGAGVSPRLLALADETVIIPMRGEAESLNVAMAATVLLFEALRQREYGNA